MPHSVSKAAKKFGLPVVEPEANNNVMLSKPQSSTVYVFTDFENNNMFRRVEVTSDSWILGPTALEQLTMNPELKVRKKPTYCYSMFPFIFYINCPEDFPLMKRMVTLLKWMGGRFVREPNFHTTHMITTTTLAKGYTYCSTFKVPILSPAWVEHCWSQRNVTKFDATSIMERFRVRTFVDLYIAFKGYDSEDLKNVEAIAEEEGAVIVEPDDLRCTHLVYSHDVANPLNITNIPTHIQYVVSENWFTSSLDLQKRAFEDHYLCFSGKEIRKSIWAMEDAPMEQGNSKNEEPDVRASLNDRDKIWSDNAKREAKDLKRKYAFEELYSKEKNYLQCLKQLVDIQKSATDVSNSGGALLNQTEAKLIFGNVEKLVKIHQELIDYFENVLTNWSNDSITVHQIIILKDDILKQYEMYTNNYNESKKLLGTCMSKNKSFRKLLKNSMNATNREHPKDIFIRPIQRLCSLVLQLQEINRHTRDDNPDKKVLKEAIDTVKDALEKINSSVKLYERFLQVYDVHQSIKNCPPNLLTYHREFITQFLAQEVIRKNSETVGGMHLMLFLFSDILEIAKIKVKPQAALMNPYACESLKKKTFEHIATIPLSMVINVIEFEGHEGDDQQVFGLNIKDTKEEGSASIHCFQYSEKNHLELKEIIILITKQLAKMDCLKSPKDFIIPSMPITRISMMPIATKPDETALEKVKDLLKIPNSSSSQKKIRVVLKRSLSCGDLIDSSSE